MKIAIVSGFFLPIPALRGGATEKIWHRLAGEFAAAGHEVTIVSRRWPGLPHRGRADGIEHIRVRGFDHSRRLAWNLLCDAAWGLRVAAVLPPADAVIMNTVTLPAWLPRLRRTPMAVVLGRAPKGQIRWYRKAARIYATSRAVADQAVRQDPAAAQRIKVIWNPIDWGLHAAAARQRPPPVTIGFVGRVHPEKGVELLMAAAELMAADERLPDWRFEIVGPADIPSGGGGEAWLKELRRRHPTLNERRVRFRGPEFDPARLAAAYGGMDVFCYPSLAERGETFGVAVAEAMAAGAAPVVSGLDCFSEFVRSGENGRIFDHRSPDRAARLARALSALVSDPAGRQRMARAASEAVRRFDYPVVAKNILDDLRSLAH